MPEKYGVDFLWWRDAGPSARGWCGVQRKEVADLMASVRDGRLAREVKQMAPLAHAMLVVEGRVDRVGSVVTVGRAQMDVAHWDAVLWGVQEEGIKVQFTTSTYETCLAVARYEAWTQKLAHSALRGTRDPVPRNSWGKSTNRDYQIHLLTGLPGIGEELAGRIVDHFGKLPWTWTVTEEELCQVQGIGPKKARRMMEALSGG